MNSAGFKYSSQRHRITAPARFRSRNSARVHSNNIYNEHAELEIVLEMASLRNETCPRQQFCVTSTTRSCLTFGTTPAIRGFRKSFMNVAAKGGGVFFSHKNGRRATVSPPRECIRSACSADHRTHKKKCILPRPLNPHTIERYTLILCDVGEKNNHFYGIHGKWL